MNEDKTILEKAIEALVRIVEDPNADAETTIKAVTVLISLERNGLL